MTTVEIILLVAGILCLIASFMIPDEKKIESKEESSVNRQSVQELTQAEQDKVIERINEQLIHINSFSIDYNEYLRKNKQKIKTK